MEDDKSMISLCILVLHSLIGLRRNFCEIYIVFLWSERDMTCLVG